MKDNLELDALHHAEKRVYSLLLTVYQNKKDELLVIEEIFLELNETYTKEEIEEIDFDFSGEPFLQIYVDEHPYVMPRGIRHSATDKYLNITGVEYE